MPETADSVSVLTQADLFEVPRRLALQRFAKSTGWRPTYEIVDLPTTADLANGHLVVEHGLDNSAVLSFLRGGFPFSTLAPPAQRRLLGVSYNNLVDYQLFPDSTGTTFVYNRADPPVINFSSIREDARVWTPDFFHKVSGRQRPSSNLRRLDDALIRTVANWKRLLPTEAEVSTSEISSLFNAIIFTRALEDHSRRKKPQEPYSRLLIDPDFTNQLPVSKSLSRAFRTLDVTSWPEALIKQKDVEAFDVLAPETVAALFRDFYINRYAPYEYDFSIMSKHALSRIYEKYVSVLRSSDSDQLALLPEPLIESTNRELGAYYTPQYIARFFTRFLHDNLTPVQFRNIRVVDPACGSAMFLRTLLEAQCDPWESRDVIATAQKCLANMYGIDVDPNACHAARLSLALLHLVLTDKLPSQLNILQSEAADFLANSDHKGAFDAIITNPPFVPWTRLADADRETIRNRLTDYRIGRSDLYLLVLKLAMDATKNGGYLLFVLPHSFLLAQTSRQIRDEIARDFFVRILADLSNISVFEDVGSYVILLVIQKKAPQLSSDEAATVIRCKDHVGYALEDALDGHRASNDFYQIYDVDQTAFQEREWALLSPKQTRLRRRIFDHPSLDEFLQVRQGMNTGSDDIFIIPKSHIPNGDRNLYVPLLADKQMAKFSVPSRVSQVVFYPYVQGSKITEQELQTKHKGTWKYLESHKKALSARASVRNGKLEWWSPERPRNPKEMLRPKIVTPHLVVVPKFSLDLEGQFAVSRSPFLFPLIEGSDELLLYFLSVLNSSVAYWQIATASHRYGGGYLMLEPKTLRRIRVPDPTGVPVPTMKDLVRLTRSRIRSETNLEAENKLDELVCGLYGLVAEERKLLGMEL